MLSGPLVISLTHLVMNSLTSVSSVAPFMKVIPVLVPPDYASASLAKVFPIVTEAMS